MRTYLLLTLILTLNRPVSAANADPLTGTKRLTGASDIASQLVDGVDRFLLRKTAESVASRRRHWNRDCSSVEAYNRSVEANRLRLAHQLGIRDARVRFDCPQLVATTQRSARMGSSDQIEIRAVRWPVLGHPQPGGAHTVSIHAEGLLLTPTGKSPPRANVIAVPDAGQTPEQLVGLEPGVAPESQFARRLAENGCRVLVPALINRDVAQRGRAQMTNREYIYRSAYELGRHLIGYEVQSILAGVDWLVTDGDNRGARIGVVGYGEGGMLALYAGALDPRIDAICVSGFFGPLEEIWSQPMDRNVFGLLEMFGACDLATLVAPRTLVVETARGPEVTLSGGGGAPALLASPDAGQAQSILTKAKNLVAELSGSTKQPMPFYAVSPQPETAFGSKPALELLLQSLFKADGRSATPTNNVDLIRRVGEQPRQLVPPDPTRHERLLEEMDRHNQLLLRESPFVRAEFMKNLDTSSVEAYQQSVEHYRNVFHDEVIGKFDDQRLPFNARSRVSWETETWTGYEVVLDVFEDVIAYGVLLLPKDLEPGERRPVVVCQHGLEGRPTDTFLDDHQAFTISPRSFANVGSSRSRRKICTFSKIGFARCSARQIRWEKLCSQSLFHNISRSWIG